MPDKKCKKCDGKGWYFVDERIGNLQGRKDCDCTTKIKSSGSPKQYK